MGTQADGWGRLSGIGVTRGQAGASGKPQEQRPLAHLKAMNIWPPGLSTRRHSASTRSAFCRYCRPATTVTASTLASARAQPSGASFRSRTNHSDSCQGLDGGMVGRVVVSASFGSRANHSGSCGSCVHWCGAGLQGGRGGRVSVGVVGGGRSGVRQHAEQGAPPGCRTAARRHDGNALQLPHAPRAPPRAPGGCAPAPPRSCRAPPRARTSPRPAGGRPRSCTGPAPRCPAGCGAGTAPSAAP